MRGRRGDAEGSGMRPRRAIVATLVAALLLGAVMVPPAHSEADDPSGVRFGIITRLGGASWGQVLSAWKEIERLGFDSAWMNDHLLGSSPSPEDAPQLEAWTTLAALAAETERVEIGTLVTANTFRNPALLTKMATTVDIISNGRLVLGIGAGWTEREHEAYGLELGTARERAEKLDEALQVITKLWSGEPATFDGKYYTLKDAPLSPMPVRRPHPPIMVGGQGKKWIVPLVGRYGDRWNANVPVSVEGFEERIQIIRDECESVKRDDCPTRFSKFFQLLAITNVPFAGSAIELGARVALGDAATNGLLAGSPADITAKIQKFVDAGANEILIALLEPFDHDDLRILAEEVVPNVRPAATAPEEPAP